MTLSERQHAILVHCCGFRGLPHVPGTVKHPRRNYYCSQPGQDGYEQVAAMVAAGFMERESIDAGGCFRATGVGVAVARMEYRDYVALVGTLTMTGTGGGVKS